MIVDNPDGTSEEVRTCITGAHYFEGKKVREASDLRLMASVAGVGKAVKITVVGTSGRRRTVEVTLGEVPDGAR